MPDEPRTIESLPPAMLEAIRRDAEHFPSFVRSKGRDYLADGRVGPLEIGAGRIAATVRGSRPYRTSWRWNGSGVDPRCTCPVGPLCKHAYAVALAAVSEHGAATSDEPPAPPRGNAFAPPPPSRRRDPAIEALRAAEPWNRAYAFGRVVAAGRGRGVFLSPYEFRAILEDPDPDLMCWRLAQEIPKRSAGWLPAGLEGYRDRPDLAARAEERARHEMEEGLARWARRHAAAPARSLRVLLGLARDESGAPTVTVEARVTTPRLSDEPRSVQQLITLANEARREPGMLAPPHARLLRALTAGVQGPPRHGDGRMFELDAAALGRLLDNFADTALVTWGEATEPGLRARAGVSAGGRIRYEDEPLDILPVCVNDAAGMRIALAARWPDGRQRTLESIVHLESDDDLHPSLVLADGGFWRVGEAPPHDLLQRFTASGSLPVPEHGRESFLEILSASFASVAEALAPHTRRHDARPLIALDLHDDDWMELRLFAHTGDAPWQPGRPAGDAIVFEFAPEGRWARSEAAASTAAGAPGAYESVDAGGIGTAAPAPGDAGDAAAGAGRAPAVATATAPPEAGAPPAPGDVWLEAPDPARVEPAREWLVSLVPPSDGRTRAPEGESRPGWWLRLSARHLERFAEAWDRRPEDVTWLGNRRLRELLGGTRTVRPSVRVLASGVDWFQMSAAWESEGLALTDSDLARLRAARTRFVKLSSGWVRRELAEQHDADAALLADLGLEAGAGEQRVSLWQLAQARRESLAALENLGADPATLVAVEELRRRVREFRGLPRIAPPRGLVAELRPYQREGLDFLAFVTGLGRGAVLADDMGLGKTVQALAWLLHMREREPGLGPALVVCPASVVHNWVREAERFTPGLRVLALTSGEERHELRRAIPSHDLVVTNYALLRRDLASWKEVELAAVILDEAQNIKNPDAAVSRGVLQLNARHRLALTGTPLENRALDLWSIMQFVNPGYLGSRRSFTLRYDRPDAPPHLRALLSAKLRPVLLRRLKRQVATDLPDRIEERLDCPLTEGQRKLYLAELTESREKLRRVVTSPEEMGRKRFEILAALTRLRQVCCHPALIGGRRSLGSGKFDALFEMLEPLLQEGHKVLLFSQFVELLTLLREDMTQRNIRHHVLTGSTTKREQVVRAFEEDPEPCVFLISLKAGGTGLNLTAASYVVLFDPWWNPAVEAQAIDRTHRIGQTRTVIAYRMLAEGTIEERIWELQQKKAALARDVIGEDGFAHTLTGADLDFLLED